MAQYDGSIRINTKIDAKGTSSQLSALENRMVKTADKIASLRSKMESLGKSKVSTKEYEELDRELGKLTAEFDKIAERQHRFLETGGKENSSTYKRMEYDLDSLDMKQDEVIAKMKELESSGKAYTPGADTSQYAQYAEQLKYAENEAAQLAQKHSELEQKAASTKNQYVGLADSIRNAFGLMKSGLKDIPFAVAQKGIEGLKSAFSSLGSVAKSTLQKAAVTPLNMLVSAAKKAVSIIPGIGKSFRGTGNTVNSTFKNILKYGLGIRSLYVLVNKLRTALKEGFTNLYNANLNGFKSQVDSLKGSLLTLKNALAAAFSPIVSIAIPYIQKLISWLTAAINAIGQVIAKLTGQKTYTRAIQQTTDATEAAADATNDAADATDNAAEAAEGYLSPLDEINKYETDKSSGSSSGGGGGGGGGTSDPIMFEEVPIDSKWADIADWLKQMWEDADFTELGTLIGTKLKNALDNIPWDGIQATARKIGSSIATLINGFVEVAGLGYTIGNTLAQAINTAFNFLNEFVHKLHWDSIGRFIAESMNGLFENIDWDLIKDTFVTGAKGLGDTINNFNDYFNWEAFANNVSNFFNTIIDTLYTFITTVDWKSLGKSVGKTLSDAFMGIDWGKAGKTVGEAFKAFFNFLSEVLNNIDWAGVGNSVKEFLEGIDWIGVFTAVVDFIVAAGVALLETGASLIGGLIADMISAAIDYFKEKIEECGGDIVLGILKGILDAIVGIGEWIYEHIFEPFIEGFKSVFGISSPSTVMQEMGTYIIQGLLNGITSLVDKVKEIWNGMKETAVQVFTAVGEFLANIWNGIKTNAESVWNGLKTMITTVWNGIKTVTTTVWSTIKSAITTLWNGLKTTATSVFNSIKSVINTIWNGIKSVTTSVWNGIKTSVTSAINGVKSTITSVLNTIQSIWNNIWSSCKQTVVNIWNGIVSVITSAINTLTSWINSLLSLFGSASSKASSTSSSKKKSSSSYSLRSASTLASLSDTEIPAYATGQVIPTSMKKHLAVLGDNSKETEVVSPLSTMKQALKEAAMEMGLTGNNSGTIVIKQYLDGKQIAESVIKEGKVQQMSTGKNIFSLA